MRLIKEILRLKFECKLSNRCIAKSLGISRGAVNNYLKRLTSENISWPLPENIEPVLLNLLYNNKETTTLSSSNYADINCEHLSKELKRKGVTLQLLWEEYCQANSSNYYSRSHFYAIYRDWCKKRNVVMRQQHNAYSDQNVPSNPVKMIH